MDRHLFFMLGGGLVFGLLFGVGGIFILEEIGFIYPNSLFGSIVGGILGIATTSIGLIVGVKISML